ALTTATLVPSAGASASETGTTSQAAGAGVRANDGEPKREALAPRASESERARAEVPPAETAYLYRISGRVRDGRDLPLAGARVFLAPRGLPFNRVAVSDEEGRFALEYEGR